MAAKKSMTNELLDLMKFEAFTKIVCGLDTRVGTTVAAVKSKYPALMTEHWVDCSATLNTNGSAKPLGIYEIFGKLVNKPALDVKDEVLDWMSDKRRELAANMSIAFNQRDLNIVTWMSLVDKDDSPADEFTLYCLCRLYSVHCIVMTKGHPWSTISRQFTMKTEDIWIKSELKLVYLGPGEYGEIKHVRVPATFVPKPPAVAKSPRPHRGRGRGRGRGKGRTSKTTCRSSDRLKERSRSTPKPTGQTIQSTGDQRCNVNTSRPVRENRKRIDYLRLNDGLDMPSKPDLPSPKRSKRSPVPARKGPSKDRMLALSPIKETNAPKIDTLTGETTGKLTGVTELLGETVPPKNREDVASGTLPDLVVNSNTTVDTEVTDQPANLDPTAHDISLDPGTTESEDDAIDALLNLWRESELNHNPNVDALEENAQLMPIGGAILPIDAAPVQVRLDQESVNREIANLQEEALPSVPVPSTMELDNTQVPSESSEPRTNKEQPANTEDQKEPILTKQGQIEMKEYSIKRNPSSDKLKFKCVKCEFRSKTRKEVNKHYIDNHEPLLCDKCNKLFNTPSSLSLHMYDHEEQRFKCELCNKGYHFKGQLKQHKADHNKTPSFQCMRVDCGRWFKRKGDLVLHLETHKNLVWSCNECDHKTTCEKYLKEHVRDKHRTDEANFRFKCAICNKKFLYRTQLTRHAETHLKNN